MTTLKLVFHKAANVGDKLQTAFAREFLKRLETFAGVLSFVAGFSVSSRESQGSQFRRVSRRVLSFVA